MSDDGLTAAEALIEAIEEPRRSQMRRFHALVLEALPGIDVALVGEEGPMIGYGWFDYSTRRGPAGRWPAIGLANRKQYISLYSMATAGDRYLVETWADRFPGAKHGKSCLNIRRPEKVADDAVRDLARATWDQFKTGVHVPG